MDDNGRLEPVLNPYPSPEQRFLERTSGTYGQSPVDFVSGQTAAEDGQRYGFTDALASTHMLGPTQRIIANVRANDYLGTVIATSLPSWMGGITFDQYDDTHQPAPQEPFDVKAYIARLQPQAQQLAAGLMAAGHLDGVSSPQEMNGIMGDAMSVQDDIDTLAGYQRDHGFIKTMGASMLAGLSDPIFLVPIGGEAAAGAMATGTAAKFLAVQGLKGAGTMAAINLATKKIVDASSYDLTNEPGMGDEIAAVGFGAGLGMLMPAAGYVARNGLASTVNGLGNIGVNVPFGMPAWARRWGSQKHLQQMFKKMNTVETPMISQRSSSAFGEGGDAALRELGGRTTFDGERARSIQILDDFIKDAKGGTFYEDLSVAPLDSGSDSEITQRLDELRDLYAKHRRRLRRQAKNSPMGTVADPEDYRVSIYDHPAKDDWTRLLTLRAVANANEKLHPAPSKNPLLYLFMRAGDELPTGNTPASRMSQVDTIYHDIMRSLSASFMDYTPEQMALEGPARSSAESIKDRLDLQQAAMLRDVVGVLKRDKLIGPASLRLDKTNEVLSQAVDLILDRQNASAGVATKLTGGAHPAAVEIADLMEGYFRNIKDELVQAGLFDASPFGMSHFVPLMMDGEAASRNPEAFRSAAIAQFKMLDQERLPNQVRLDALARAFDRTTDDAIKAEILDAVRNHVGDPAFTAKNGNEIRARLEDPGVSTLPPPSALGSLSGSAYADSLDAIYREGADRLYKDITDPWSETRTFESISSAAKPDTFNQRTFTTVAPEMRDFIMRDPVTILNRYRAQVHGQIGIARAIQLHPDVYRKLAIYGEDGSVRQVQNAADLLEWIGKSENAMSRMADMVGGKEGQLAKDAFGQQVIDQQAMVKRLIGQTLYEGGSRPHEATMFFTRNLMRLMMPVQGGMMGVTNLMDLYPKLMYMTFMHPVRGTQLMFEMFAPVARQLRRRDLEFMSMVSQLAPLSREMNDYVLSERGIGSGIARTVTGRFDSGSEFLTRNFTHLSLLDYMHDLNGRLGTIVAMDEAISSAKKFARAIASGAADPVAESGLSATEIARLNRVGINRGNVKDVLAQVHKHGVFWDRSPASAMTFDEFLGSDRPVNPLFDRWNGALKDRRVIADNLANEGRRFWTVKPGLADRAIMADSTPVVRLINQFAGFSTAFNKQRLHPILQSGAAEQTAWLASMLLFGWMKKAAVDDLTGRKNFEDSVAELQTNPKASVWGATQETHALGNIMRSFAYMDNFGYGPSQLFKQDVSGGTFGSTMRWQRDRGQKSGAEMVTSLFGPAAQYVAHAADAINAPPGPQRDYMISQLTPLQNLVWSRILNRAGISEKVNRNFFAMPGLVPSDTLRPVKPVMRAR